MITELINITKGVFLSCFNVNEQRKYRIGHFSQKIIFKLRFKYIKGIIKLNIKADNISYLLSSLIIIGIMFIVQTIIQIIHGDIYKFISKIKVMNIII
jgi:hypothetical protein